MPRSVSSPPSVRGSLHAPSRLADRRPRPRAAAPPGRVRGPSRSGCRHVHAPRSGGVGKSRLMEEFLAEVGPEADGAPRPVPVLRRGHHVLPRRRSNQAGGGSRRLRSAGGGRGEDRRAPRGRGAFGSPPWASWCSSWGSATSPRPGDLSGRSAGCSRRWRAGGPLVLVFDDVHWGEATFLDLVEHIADWSRDAPDPARLHVAARAARQAPDRRGAAGS